MNSGGVEIVEAISTIFTCVTTDASLAFTYGGLYVLSKHEIQDIIPS